MRRNIITLRLIAISTFFVLISYISSSGQSGLCDPITPFYKVDLSGSVDSVYTSPSDAREGLCCSNSNPDRCIEFEVTLDSSSVGINFDFYSGAVPPGALFYQIGCGPSVPVGQPICLSGVGPHTLTFCKPGNNQNQYQITAIPGFTKETDRTTVEGCDAMLSVSGLIDSTITWKEITSGSGTYDSYLSCTSGCSETTINTDVGFPSFIDFEVCGTLFTSYCTSIQTTICDTIRLNIKPALDVSVLPDPASLCGGDSVRILNVGISGFAKTIRYIWKDDLDGIGNTIGTDSFYLATSPGNFSVIVEDTSFNGCSVDTANIVVTFVPPPALTISMDDTICKGGNINLNVTGASTYNWSPSSSLSCDTCPTVDASPPATTLYHVVGTDTNGCIASDSVLVTVFDPVVKYLGLTICNGDAMVVGGSAYTSSGTYYDTLVAANGCDSIVITNLTVLPPVLTNLSPSFCSGNNITVGTSTYDSTGVYFDTLTAINGCDSIIQTDLTVLEVPVEDISVEICDGESFTVGSSVYSASGNYNDTLVATNGCDSIINTDLTVIYPKFVKVITSICNGESYSVGTSNYTTTGSYFDTLTAASGCDSIVQTDLTVIPQTYTTLDTSICPGEVAIVGTSVYSGSGSYVDTLLGSNGCDSIVTLNLTILPIPVETLNLEICQGDSVVVGSSVYYNTGTYNDILTGPGGCDSVVITSLQVIPLASTTINPVLCYGDAITVGSSVYNATGIYQDTLMSWKGCDSIVTTNLTVIDPKRDTINVSICSGESFSIGSSNYTTGGNYSDTLTAMDGCDSVVTLNLTILPLSVVTLNITICQDDSMEVGSSVYTTSGSYVDTLTKSNGCDSIVTLNLNVLPISVETLDIEMCQGDSAIVGGSIYTSSGTYYDTLTGANGCDSIVITSVVEHAPVYTTVTPFLCYGETFTVGSSTYDSTGSYVDSLIASSGCDSIVTTSLVVADSLFITINTTICYGESYDVGSSSYTSSGVYYDTIATSGICDSIILTTLTVLPVSSDSLDTTICEGQAVMVGPSMYSTSGSYIDTLTGANGCDSVVTLNLTVLPVSVDTLDIEMCQGDSIMVGSSVYFNAGTFYDTLPKTNACDSIVITSIQLLYPVYNTINPSICLGESFTVDSSNYTISGSYYDTLIGSHGCDSILTTNLTVINPKHTTISASVCSGESYSVGSSSYSMSGTYIDTLAATSDGCDSIIQTNLTVKAKSNVTIDRMICPGEIVIVGTSVYTNDGSYIDTLTGSNGCDSIVNLNLTVLPIAVETLNTAICQGDSVIVGSSVYHNAGTFHDILTGPNGCDSIVITTIQILYPVYTSINPVKCNGETFMVGSSVYSSTGNYQDTLLAANGCDSIISTDLTVLPVPVSNINPSVCMGESFPVGSSMYSSPGNYTDTLTAANGCDSIIITILTVLPVPVSNIAPVICDGESFTTGSSVYSAAGAYVDTLVAANGCDSIVHTNLTVLPLSLKNISPQICYGESFSVGPSTYTVTGIYTDTLVAANGCDSIVTTDLTVIPQNTTSLNISICDGESFNVGSSVYSTGGNYSDTLLAASGCDSIINTDLTLLPVPVTSISPSICPGETFTVGYSTYSATGNYKDTLTASNSCDSIINTTLTVLPVPVSNIAPVICSGESFTTGSSLYTVAGNYVDTLVLTNVHFSC